MTDTEISGASATGYSYSGQYGVRRASTRPDVYRTQFGSMTADEYITPMIHTNQRRDGNVARRLSRNSFLIPPQIFVRRATDAQVVNKRVVRLMTPEESINNLRRSDDHLPLEKEY